VETVGIVENFPLNETTLVTAFSTEEGAAEGASEYALGVTFAAGDYFAAMGIELKRGRDFTEAEQLQNPGHVLVSESTAARLWPGEDPIGKVVTVNQFGLRETVIGVVEDVRQSDFRNAAGPGVYFPMVLQRPEINALSTPAYVLRTSRAASIARDVRALIDEVAPEAPMYRVYTIEQLVGDSMARLSFTLIALGLAAGLALLLGMVGLYGILASTVAERTRELGIRIALGADPARVRRMVVVQGLRVVALGVAVGIAGALFGARALEGLLYGVEALDVVTLVGTSAVMLIVGAVASWVPAYRASSVDPVATLAES
jgi:ABC-type antimicrobial peptide transport system permease subunit